MKIRQGKLKTQCGISTNFTTFQILREISFSDTWFTKIDFTKNHSVRKNCNICPSQCENLAIFLPLRFYVKSILVIFEAQKLLFPQFQRFWIFS